MTSDRPVVRTEFWGRAQLLETHAACVDDLLVATGAPLTAGRRWWGAWLDAYPDVVPWVVARIDVDEKLRALAPLARRHRVSRVQLVGIGDGTSDYLRLPARSDADADALADVIASHLLQVRRPWALALRQLPPDDPVAEGLVVRLRHARIEGGGPAPRTAITSRDAADYLSRNYRKAARNRFRRLERAGHEPRIAFLHRSHEVAAVLDAAIAISREREREIAGRSHFDDPRHERFFRAVTVALAEEDSLEVALLLADERIAAYQFNLLDGGVYRTWHGHHDPAWAEFSPGHVLDHRVIERVLADDAYHELDWMMGTESYKLRAATHTVGSVELLAASSPLTAAVAFGPRRLRARLVAVARDDERGARALELLRGVRGALHGSVNG